VNIRTLIPAPLREAMRRARSSHSVGANVVRGQRVSIGRRSWLWAPRSLRLGDDVWIGSDVRIEVDGRIGDGVLIANRVGIVGRSDHDMHEVGTPIRFAAWVGREPERLSHPVTIGSDTWLGYGCVVLSGVTIGDSSVIGAGAIVVSDVPANSIAVGSPARVVNQRFSESDLILHWKALSQRGVRPLVPDAAVRLPEGDRW
jgi:acetyltransferase-like isoleucine patch superfamily enzyme